MKRLVILGIVLLITQTYYANAESTIFTNQIIDTERVIATNETWTIEDDINLILNNMTTNYGTIIIKGSLYNNQSIKNYGVIINNDTLINNHYIINYGVIINNGILNNTYVINNANIINNTGVINNKGYIYNFGTINNNTGTVNDDDMLALFPGIISGKINNNGLIIEPNSSSGSGTIPFVNTNACDLTLSSTVISEGESIIASVDTNAANVKFEWIDPLGQVQRNVVDNSSPFSDTYAPMTHGEWAVNAICDNGMADNKTFSVSLNVLPESPIGVIAILMTSISIFAAYMYKRIH
ncbi:MAG: hypothetical protein KatS3mg003_2014 [Candidatus Nitrosocaldaceae archaeon]|nr:MAG: hypothetical protein KatS3mg003_2014 [Candidatus Nitrosocaldaceae archaeon]